MDYTYNKHELKKKLRKHFNSTFPELQMHFTNHLFERSLDFINGFVACLSVMGEEPIQKAEADELLFQQLSDFLVKEMSSHVVV